MSERIGIVLVHGVGEQKRFEHLSAETLQIVCALQNKPGVSEVSVQPRTTQDSPYAAEQQTWLAENGAPLRIDFIQDNARKTLFVHEVWWADLDTKTTLMEQIRFWFWALGRWGFLPYDVSKLDGFRKMEIPKFPDNEESQRNFTTRLRLWFLGFSFLLAMATLFPLTYLLRRFGLRIPGPDIFYQYLGDVKLYQDFLREGQGDLTDVGDPPRTPIRRRMVRSLIDAYFAHYDRWYVLAHSLGTVLAWNGLMETGHCLPNYLDEATWKKCLDLGDGLTGSDKNAGPVTNMRPRRPVWIEDDGAIIHRKKLFSKLCGFVTYGSPLDKFAYMWSAIVPINKDKGVFDQRFEWVNVYDHTDPVAAELKAYDGYNGVGSSPENLCYKASPILLLSHIKYLIFKKDKPDCMVNQLTDWLLNADKTFRECDASSRPSWDDSPSWIEGLAIRIVWWTGAVIVMALLFGWVTASLFGGNMLTNAILAVSLSALIVMICGPLLRIYEVRYAESIKQTASGSK